ncbi:MAG: chromosome partitioning protein [Caudoviricetes sp.]|nr:MAG: chromosome partitioning protein [Caudoviricetes sp.]
MTNVTTISSQSYINDEIVAEKIEAKDFDVFVSPVFEIDGESYRVVMDGHHSLAAAKEAGVQANYIEQDCSDNDTICLLDAGNIDDFLAANRIDCDFYDVATGNDIW